MLTGQDSNKIALSPVKKSSARIIKLKKQAKIPFAVKKEQSPLYPPVNEFNTGYIKAKDNDPL